MKRPDILRDEANNEGYEYFDREVRPLPKGPDGKVNPKAKGLSDNDVDAFRHAYVDTEKRAILLAGEFVALIESGQYPGYTVKMINGLRTPISNPDSRGTNNLG